MIKEMTGNSVCMCVCIFTLPLTPKGEPANSPTLNSHLWPPARLYFNHPLAMHTLHSAVALPHTHTMLFPQLRLNTRCPLACPPWENLVLSQILLDFILYAVPLPPPMFLYPHPLQNKILISSFLL